MAQQEELRLGVGAGSPGAARIPGPADLEPAVLRAEGEVSRAPDRLAAPALDDGEGDVQAGITATEGILEPVMEALPVGGCIPWKPAPDLGILCRFPQVLLVLFPQRLDDDEPALEARCGSLPARHYASMM
jgi:hypothetical protein